MIKPVFHNIRWTLVSSNVLAFCRRVISSKLGCRHRPGDGVAVADCVVVVFVDCGVAGLEVLGGMTAVACLTSAPAVSIPNNLTAVY